MSDITLEQKCKLASTLVEQTPPGEINDVINDIRAIIADDEALMPHVLPALRAYNLKQLHVVEHPEEEGSPAHTSLLSEASIVPGAETERYIDAAGKRSFAFDHLTFTVSDYQPYQLPDDEEQFRAELAGSLTSYTKNHFPSGYASVSCSQFPLNPEPQPSEPTPAAAVPVESPKESSEPVAKATETSEIPEATPPADEASASVPLVTDVVPEQINAGDLEPAPTPAIGDVADVKKEELVEPENLEKLDEIVEEEKEKEEGLGEAGELAEERPKVEGDEVPAVEEASPVDEEKVPAVAEESAVAPEETPVKDVEENLGSLSVEEKKQERVENPVYTLEVVGNRYNPSNFWTGRWRTRWTVDQAAGQVNGLVNVDVHYYEQGNVQLATSHTASFPYPAEPKGTQSVASQIVTSISKIETLYHLELNDVYAELGDKAFRALRRALPVTRQKMDWDKVTSYTLGADLTKARG
ncbi:hypothetical protein B9479_001245 [Cryptococcus floricola]|uniref:F-actin-capping protein subunit alpha n=1 Tax=Cryptococcus floricola TaxID=2591691 RepID=A0A5D3B680_9TREE|nr:hypothetical protein B9479_001245 [Cryptococcus floricola]